MELIHSKIIVRPLNITDSENFYEAVCSSIEEVSRWLPWCHHGYCIDETVQFINRSAAYWQMATEFNFIIIEKSSNKVIGGCGLNRFDMEYKTANLGYWIRTGYTGKGYATAASIITSKFGSSIFTTTSG